MEGLGSRAVLGPLMLICGQPGAQELPEPCGSCGVCPSLFADRVRLVYVALAELALAMQMPYVEAATPLPR